MNKRLVTLFILNIFLIGNISFAQNVLPEFKLKQIAPGKISISWHNPFKNCVQLSIQRSIDNKKFNTIISAKNPSLFENSFTDTKSPKNKITYYRIQYILKGGKYFFSQTHSLQEKEFTENNVSNQNPISWKASPFVFTNKNGYIQILLNDPMKHTYRLIFQDDQGNEIFEIKKVSSDNLILDNTNFMHGGWFQFELYKDGVLLEKNKVFLKSN